MEFKKIIAGAFFYVGKYRKALMKALALPFMAYLAIDGLALLDAHPAVSWLLVVLSVAIQAVFAVTTHRIVLLGPNSVPSWGITSWTRRETFFVLHIVGLSLLMIPIGALGLIPVVGGVVALVLICWIFGRLSLVFPGIAVDKGVSFKLSWKMTENYQILMFLVVVIFPILLAIPAMLIAFIPHTALLTSFISTFIIVFEVAALSMAYQLITSEMYEYEKG